MEKIFITTPEQARTILLEKYPDATKPKNNPVQARKIRTLSDVFIWCLKDSANTYVGITEHGDELRFDSEALLDWFPYNGEWISDFTQIFFNGKGIPYLSIIEFPNGEATREIILKGDYRARGGMLLIASSQYKGGSQIMQYYWAIRASIHEYSAASILDGTHALINSTEVEKTYHREEVLMERFILQGNVLIPKG